MHVALACALLASAPPDTDRTKLLLVPYEGIEVRIAPETLEQATDHLAAELDAEGFEVIRAGTLAPPPSSDAFESTMAQARALEAERRIVESIAVRRALVRGMHADPRRVPSVEAYARAQLMLARALFWDAQDEAARVALEAAVRVGPTRALPADGYSRRFRQHFKAAVARLGKAPRGRLLVRSSVPHPRIALDGVTGDAAPVRFAEVVAGRHLVSLEVPRGGPVHRFVEVVAGAETLARVEPADIVGGPTVGGISASVLANQISEETLTAAVLAAMREGAAYVVFGGLHRARRAFEAHTFVVDVEQRTLARLDTVRFDLELLTAAVDVLSVARSAGASIRAQRVQTQALGRSIVADRPAPRRVPAIRVPWPAMEAPEATPKRHRRPIKPLLDLDKTKGALPSTSDTRAT